ncbi:MAG: 50S ribosomal protein L18, partial [Actinomycetota bacterium]|nr:50S ribosomal protein L18 [Actinomycetota bacterium]
MDPRDKRQARRRRQARARARLGGTPDRPRLSVYRSNAAIYAQVIDDLAGHTMVAASSLDEGLAADAGPDGGKTAVA